MDSIVMVSLFIWLTSIPLLVLEEMLERQDNKEQGKEQ